MPCCAITRLRIASGIQHAELIAVEVQQQQASLLASVKAGQLAAERAGYEAMLTQAAADAKSKVGRACGVHWT